MRVCFYREGAAWSGAGRAFAEAARALGTRGYEVTMACGAGTETERQWRSADLDVLRLPAAVSWWCRAWSLRALLASRFIEVVFVHSEREQLSAACAVRMVGRGAVVRRVPPFAPLTLGADALLAGRLAATGFLFASAADRRAAQPNSRWLEPVVAPPAVALPPPGPARSDTSDRQTIACLYGDSSLESVAAVLRTIALLARRHPDLRLSMVGPLAVADAVRIQAAALGINGMISQWVGPPDRQEILAGATLARVVAGRAEGDDVAYALLDCFAAGVPVIGEREPIIARFVSHGENGQLLSSADPPEQAAVVAALLSDVQGLARLSRVARDSAARWPVDAMAGGFERAAAGARDRSRWRA